MKIGRANSSKEILRLLAEGTDIVILEYPKGTAVEAWCHVFIPNRLIDVANTLWHQPRWFKVILVSNAKVFCLYSPYNYTKTLNCITEWYYGNGKLY